MMHVADDSRQARAIAHVEALSSGSPLDPAHRIHLHFHPDRLHGGVSVLEALARDGVYLSQFETATSNGSLSAHPGGSRWEWEHRIFGGAYDDGPPSDRPKYGALDFRGRPGGASPRFGSAYLRTRPEVIQRATFCYPDSVFEPSSFGTAQRMSLVELALADEKDLLDDYVEAHVHGEIVLARDVEALVLDPCYRETEVEHAACTLPCAIEWHRGFRLSLADLDERHQEYRGKEYFDLAHVLARDGVLTAREIGHAARQTSHDPQALKRVWHYVARFGT